MAMKKRTKILQAEEQAAAGGSGHNGKRYHWAIMYKGVVTSRFVSKKRAESYARNLKGARVLPISAPSVVAYFKRTGRSRTIL